MKLTPRVLQLITNLRSALRRLGLLPLLDRVWQFGRGKQGESPYEAEFADALMSHVCLGDVVWDVGANVGVYTTRLAEAVGPTGRVVAFEPTPASFRELVRRTQRSPQVSALAVALGSEPGVASMNVNTDPTSPANSLALQVGENVIEVLVEVASALVRNGRAPLPNILKIDVEGFEEDVLLGFDGLLAHPDCRAILLEIHFGILEKRGKRHAPARITEMLRDAGFALSWVDRSHLKAVRL